MDSMRRSWFKFFNPYNLDKVSSKCYCLAVALIWSFGVFFVGPFNINYFEFGSWAVFVNNFFPTWCAMQMMVNWMLMKRNSETFVGESLRMNGQWVVDPVNSSQVIFKNDVEKENTKQMVAPELYNAYSTSRPVKTKDIKLKKTLSENHKYSFMSYKPCFSCQHWRPPRTHHCPICNVCVFKRDHHCFFSGTCIGEKNHRFFIVFIFYSVLAAYYGLFHAVVFLFIDFIPSNGYTATILPMTIFHWLTGTVDWRSTFLVFSGYCLLFFCPLVAGFLMEQVTAIQMGGLVSYEMDNKVPLKSLFTPKQALLSIFGKHWWLNFIIPVHVIFPTASHDPDWPEFKLQKEVMVTMVPVDYSDPLKKITLVPTNSRQNSNKLLSA